MLLNRAATNPHFHLKSFSGSSKSRTLIRYDEKIVLCVVCGWILYCLTSICVWSCCVVVLDLLGSKRSVGVASMPGCMVVGLCHWACRSSGYGCGSQDICQVGLPLSATIVCIVWWSCCSVICPDIGVWNILCWCDKGVHLLERSMMDTPTWSFVQWQWWGGGGSAFWLIVHGFAG